MLDYTFGSSASFNRSTHDRVVVSRAYMVVHLDVTNGREVAPVSDYEIIMIVLGILALPFVVCNSLLALLTFLDKRNNKRK